MPQYNNSVKNIAKILSLFTNERPRWRLTEIARELGFLKTTTYNLIITLEKIGFLSHDVKVQKYELGTRIASLGAIMVANNELNQKAIEFAQELSSKYGHSCRIGIWDSDAVLITCSVPQFHNTQVPNFTAGPRIAAYNTSLGRAILSYMEKPEVKNYLSKTKFFKYTSKTITSKSKLLKEFSITRSRGFSICNEEMVHGAASLGAPIFNSEKRIAGAISILGNSENLTGSDMKKYTDAICRTAFQISNSLGYVG